MLDNLTLSFLLRLKKIDDMKLSPRDILLLQYIIRYPGRCGLDIAQALGIGNRSRVSSNFPRLIRRGLVEDRREREAQAVPSIYVATEAGKAFWKEIDPATS